MGLLLFCYENKGIQVTCVGTSFNETIKSSKAAMAEGRGGTTRTEEEGREPVPQDRSTQSSLCHSLETGIEGWVGESPRGEVALPRPRWQTAADPSSPQFTRPPASQ